MKNICIFGLGYVGSALAAMLSADYNVFAYDIDEDKLHKLKNKISPIKDRDIQKTLKNESLNLHPTNNKNHLKDCDYALICTPTNFSENDNSFDTESIENVIKDISKINKDLCIVIKSTVPIGFTENLNKIYENEIIFSPEFLREGNALHDNYYPSRIVIGSNTIAAKEFINIMKSCIKDSNVKVFYVSSSEAESIKLFSNTYLAMRVAFFNELDSYSLSKGMDAEMIINAVCADDRIGSHYNNPSFGYGGYCLPKDTKQLESQFGNIPQKLISAIITSNQSRKDFIFKSILDKKINKIGIYRLTMKTDSDNFRSSPIIEIIENLKLSKDIDIFIYEPDLKEEYFMNIKKINNLVDFKNNSDIIVANRVTNEILDVKHKIFTRDIFNSN